ncbi:MAG: hypothetical protein K0S81_3653 [Rhodospirillales bacterium]|nr:hypothetical protein [Rhodospirillales bacterium]
MWSRKLGICAPTNTIVRDYAERLMSVERGRQLGIGRSIAHLYADVLKEPIPREIARLVGYLDPPTNTDEQPPQTSGVDTLQQGGSR